MTITFSRVTGPNGEFSNFSEHPFVLENKMWATVEHYMQAQKVAGTPLAEEIRLTESPLKALLIAKSQPVREDWEQVQRDVMHRAVLQKFRSNDDLQDQLLATGDEEIVFESNTDPHNQLGQILMEVRDFLKKEN